MGSEPVCTQAPGYGAEGQQGFGVSVTMTRYPCGCVSAYAHEQGVRACVGVSGLFPPGCP